ncbi:MAG: Xaa-Pro peptidase family protein [Thermoleophilia bacterium]
MPDVLIFGDTDRSPELRHEVPLLIGDPFFYAERDGKQTIVIGAMEWPRIREVAPQIELLPPEEFGSDELVAGGIGSLDELQIEIALRACRKLGIERATVPHMFPLELADVLRAGGVELNPDRDFFEQRRRVKNESELAGIRRAQQAANAGMGAAAALLRSAKSNGGVLEVDGKPLTVERVKRVIGDAFADHDCAADEFIVSHGPQSAIGHHMGEGVIQANEPIVIDIWPQDRESSCFADMTRTFVVGEPSDEVREWHRLCKEALDRSHAQVRAGASGQAINKSVCEIFQAAGYKTALTKEPGEVLQDGFFHGLGHGVGLEVHEAPMLSRLGTPPLVAGDVVTLEPGLYRRGYGGLRLEDLVVVTEDGGENLTDFPYDLQP